MASSAPELVDELMRILSDLDWEQTRDAIKRVQAHGADVVELAVERLAHALQDRSAGEPEGSLFRSEAVWALAGISPQVAELPLILAAESEPAWVVVCDIAEALGEVGSAACFPTLRRLLGHDVAPVVAYAADALGLLGDTGAIELLMELRTDLDPGPRASALGALVRLGSIEAAQQLAMEVRDDDYAYHALSTMNYLLTERPVTLPRPVQDEWRDAASRGEDLGARPAGRHP